MTELQEALRGSLWLTLEEAAIYSGQYVSALTAAVKVGTLQAAGVGRRGPNWYRFRPEWLDDWLKAGAVVARTHDRPDPPEDIDRPGRSPVGFVYFIATADNRHVKIGWSKKVRQRYADLQCAHPEPLRVIGYIRAGQQRERSWHRRFAAVRALGEWFVLTDGLRAAIAAEAISPTLSSDGAAHHRCGQGCGHQDPSRAQPALLLGARLLASD